MSSEWKKALMYSGRNITPRDLGIIGVAVSPLLAIPYMDGSNDETKCYEARTATNGGVLIVRQQNPIESAMNKLLRPSSTIVEVGYDKRKSLISSIYANDGKLLIDGEPIQTKNKIDTIENHAKLKGVNRVVSHQLHKKIAQIAHQIGLQHEENVGLFKKHTTKSGFNTALREYFGGVGTIGPLGIPFNTQTEIVKEYERLSKMSTAAIIKFDHSGKGMVMSGTANPLVLEPMLSRVEIVKRIQDFIKRENITHMNGEIQMYAPEHVVVSITSGTNKAGDIEIYEAHVQTQLNGAADGAIPLKDNQEIRNLFGTAWPHVAALYKKLGFTGGHNMNFLVLPPKMRQIAQALYGNEIGQIVAIDCNYRPITGTHNAMSRLQEETHQKINLTNFIYKSIELPCFVFDNIHLLFHLANECGLRLGSGGNCSFIRICEPNTKTSSHPKNARVQLIINGADSVSAAQLLLQFELALNDSKKINGLVKKFGACSQDILSSSKELTSHLADHICIE